MAAVLKNSESRALDVGRQCHYVLYMFSSRLLIGWFVLRVIRSCRPVLGHKRAAALLSGLRRFLGGDGMRDPGTVAAAVVGAHYRDAAGVEPQGHRAAPPIVDAVDDGDLL